MKVYYRNRIELIKKNEKKVADLLTKDMLSLDKKERKIWISGQSLLK